MAHILDLGCGKGDCPVRASVSAGDEVVGVDIDENGLAIARKRFPERTFQYARGESLPYPDASFDRVVSSVALPYMDIPRTLAEVRRVLVQGGSVFFSVHPLRFTLRELRNCATRPGAIVFRLFVLLNGLYFHLTAKILRLAGRAESFQTERGLKIALRRAGFLNVTFTRPDGRLIVEARRANAASEDRSASAAWPRAADALTTESSSIA